MKALPCGEWSIKSFRINQRDVLHKDGFQSLLISESGFHLRPANAEFRIVPTVNDTMRIESQGQVFEADITCDFDRLIIELFRPIFSETIVIEASPLGSSVLTASV